MQLQDEIIFKYVVGERDKIITKRAKIKGWNLKEATAIIKQIAAVITNYDYQTDSSSILLTIKC